MQIHFDSKTDLLCMRFSPEKQAVINISATDDIFCIGENHHLLGIETADASKNVDLEKILPVEFLKRIKKK